VAAPMPDAPPVMMTPVDGLYAIELMRGD